MATPDDGQSNMLAAIDRLTIAVEKQAVQIESLSASQVAASSVLEAMQ